MRPTIAPYAYTRLALGSRLLPTWGLFWASALATLARACAYRAKKVSEIHGLGSPWTQAS